MRRTDALTILALVLLAFALRLPFRSQYLYHWDSVNFALSLENYDVRLHQPHPPGYFLYSLLGSVVNSVLHDPNVSLVWVSTLAGAMGVGALYGLGKIMFDRQVGLIAALLALTNPLQWFYSEVALSYSLEFFLVTIIAGLCYLQLAGNRRVWPWLALGLGLAGGVRQNDLLFLFPLWLISLYPLAWKPRIASILILGVACLAWMLPMVGLSGGLDGYLAALRGGSEEIAEESSFSALNQLLINGGRMTVYLGYGLLLGVLPLLWGTWRFVRLARQHLADRRTWVLGLWILPAFSFYVVVHIRQHGHIFTFLPAVILLVAVSVSEMGKLLTQERQRATWALTGLLVITNGLFFLLVPPALFGMRQLPLQTPSRSTIASRDQFLGEHISAIRANFTPETTLILTDGLNFRHPDFYLRDYKRDFKLSETAQTVPDSIQSITLFADSVLWQTAENIETMPLPSGDSLRYLTRKNGEQIHLSTSKVEAEPNVPE